MRKEEKRKVDLPDLNELSGNPVELDPPTRVVDASLVRELSALARSGSAESEDTALATVVRAAYNEPGQLGPESRTGPAEFTPRTGIRGGHEPTICYPVEKDTDLRALFQRLGRFSARHRTGLGLVAALAVALGIGGVYLGKIRPGPKKSLSGIPEKVASSDMSGRDIKFRPPAKQPKPKQPPDFRMTDPGQEVCLKDAVDALVCGRLDESLELYRILAAKYPSNRSYELAAQILGRTVTRKSR